MGSGNPNPSVATRFSSENQPATRGRKRGSRDRLSQKLIALLEAELEGEGAEQLIKQAKERNPTEFLRVCAGIIPKQVEVSKTPESELSDEQIEAYYADAQERLDKTKVN